VGRQNVGHVGRRHIAPFDGAMLRVQQGGFVVGPLNLADGVAAQGTGFALIPLGQDMANQAIFRRGLDLTQALLAAIPVLRPPGA
jgi:hypothetical protein